jgi:NDP-sugar pyrophosphorylase family protein
VRGMVLAAGLGTRLRPLSYELPKPVIPVLGRPLCTYNMEFLFRCGVREFLLNLHTRPKLIQQRVAAWAGGKLTVEYTLEPLILGTGGGIRNAREFLKNGTFVTVNGDTALRFPFSPALSFHREKGALATLVLFPDPARRYTPVWTDAAGRITGFGSEAGEGTRSGFYTGCQIVEPELLSRIPPGRPSCVIRETYLPLVARRAPVYGYLAAGKFLEFGSPADYLQATMALLSDRSRKGNARPSPLEEAEVTPPVHISASARIAPGARIGPGAVLEDGSSVGEGSSVSRSILWPGAALPPGEDLRGAILTPRRRVQVAEAPRLPG